MCALLAAEPSRACARRASRPAFARAATLLLALALASPVHGATERAVTDDVRGLWVDHREADKRKVAVWIEDCDGLLCGRIYWQKKPLLADGQPKHDRHNPDAALRERPLCGLRILTGFRRTKDGAWSAGHIYNPNDGRTYSSTLQLESDGSLRVRGYVGLSLFGKTVEWVRPQEAPERCG
jgi:uncharacterized protein (DUF2147 family)